MHSRTYNDAAVRMTLSSCYLPLCSQDRCVCCSWLDFRIRKSQAGGRANVLPQRVIGTFCLWHNSAGLCRIDLLHLRVVPQIIKVQKQSHPTSILGPKTAIQASVYSINLKKSPIPTIWHSLLLMPSGQSPLGCVWGLLASIPANAWYKMGKRLRVKESKTWRNRSGACRWYLANMHWEERNTI